MTILKRAQNFCRDTDGASSVEYGLLISGIALAIFLSVVYLGQIVSTSFFKPAENLIR